MVGGEMAKFRMLDHYTIQFEFAAPNGLFIDILASNLRYIADTPEHYLKQFHIDYVDEDKLEAAAKDSGFEEWYQLFEDKRNIQYPERPVINPWVSVTPPPAGVVRWVRNPYYWKVDTAGNQLPYIDECIFEVVQDREIVVMRAIEGRLDHQIRNLDFNDMPLLVQAEREGKIAIYLAEPESNHVGIGINITSKDPIKREIFSDRRFRFAISHAINREEINQIVYLGGMKYVQQSAPIPLSPYYHEGFAKAGTEFNPQKANSILDEMGLTDKTADGKYRLRSDGKPLEIVISWMGGYGGWDQVSEMIRDYWEAVGIKTNLNPVSRDLLVEIVGSGDHDVAIWFMSGAMTPHIAPATYVPTNVYLEPSWTEYARWNLSGGASGIEPPEDIKRIIELWNEIKVTVSVEKQMELWNEIFDINAKNLYHLGIGARPPTPVVVNPKMRNVPKSFVYGWDYRTLPGGSEAAQYYLKQQ